MKGPLVVLAFASGALVACSFLAFDDFTTEDVPGADAGSQTDANDAGSSTSDGSEDSSSTADASSDGAIEGGAGPCAGGQQGTSPVSVQDHGIPSGTACNVGAGIAVDGVYSGIDRSVSQDNEFFIAGGAVSGCLRYDFGKTVIGRLFVRARSAANACGTMCYSGDCLTSEQYRLYAATDQSTPSFTFEKDVPLSRTAGDYEYILSNKRYVLVCRGGGGSARDDVEVDGVWLCP